MLNSKSANESDKAHIASLLKADKLCFNDINNDGVSLFVVDKGDEPIGYFGFEIFNEDALFRSLLVQPEHRGKGYGEQIWQLALSEMQQQGVKNIYLLTNTAADFFGKHAFTVFDRASVPDQIARTSEFAEFCPDDSICMHYKVKTQ